MPALTQEQITRARVEKKRYLLSMLLIVCANGINVLVRPVDPGNGTIHVGAPLLALVAIAFGMVTTWRLCRSINIGVVPTVITVLLAPFIFIIELVILLRIYAKRTGVGLTFIMGDKAA